MANLASREAGSIIGSKIRMRMILNRCRINRTRSWGSTRAFDGVPPNRCPRVPRAGRRLGPQRTVFDGSGWRSGTWGGDRERTSRGIPEAVARAAPIRGRAYAGDLGGRAGAMHPREREGKRPRPTFKLAPLGVRTPIHALEPGEVLRVRSRLERAQPVALFDPCLPLRPGRLTDHRAFRVPSARTGRPWVMCPRAPGT